ncbi:MAG: hypothetical protein KBI47_20185, partial [Armatimonadetes bacterium]|nr:hypothetical protein [Armatimonadota bacterium]
MNSSTLACLALAMLCVHSWATTLTDADILAGKTPQVGDVVILSDFSRCEPATAIGAQSEKGKWWLRPYKTATTSGMMLGIEERDR